MWVRLTFSEVSCFDYRLNDLEREMESVVSDSQQSTRGGSHALVHTLGAREDKNLGQVFWDFVWAPLTPPPSLYKAHHFPLQFPQFWFSIFVARKQILRVDLPMIFAARKQKQKQKSEGQTFCFRVSFCFSAGSTESVLEKHFPLVFS